MIKVSSPGKVHFLGEHSVVYGKPAILSAINLRATVTIATPVILGTNAVRTPESDLDSGRASLARMTKVVETVFKRKFNLKEIPPYQVKIDSQIPEKSGLGSSAAVSAAYCGALLFFLASQNVIPAKAGIQLKTSGSELDSPLQGNDSYFDLETINELAYECEKIFNGKPSGGDNSTVVYGGLVWFRKELEELKIINPLPFSIHKKIGQFILIDSGKPIETTKEMVEKVAIKLKYQPSHTKRIFDDQESLVKQLAQALKDGDSTSMIQIIKAGENNLEKLGVVGKKAREIIRGIEKLGGAAKIIGGGGFLEGSGYLLCYHKDFKILQKFAFRNNLKTLEIQLGEEGIKYEK